MENTSTPNENADRLADFIMFASRSFLLDLSKDLNRSNISYGQFFLLGYLAHEDYLTMTQISAKMGHSTAAATGLVDRMEKLGYVQRLHASDDRRKVMVQITRKGIELVKQFRNKMTDTIESVIMSQSEGAETLPMYDHLKGFLGAPDDTAD